MKKLIAIMLVLSLVFVFAACETDGIKDLVGGGDEAKMSNDNITIEGVYVDSSYVDEDSDALKMLYVFMEVNAVDENIDVDCAYTTLTINDSNSYDSEFYKGTCKFAPSYYYSSFIEELYVGDSMKLVLTFKVPEGDLEGGKSMVLEDPSMPFDGIEFTTDDIVFCDSAEAVCEQGDPDGYAEEMDKYSPVDADAEAAVKEQLNGYYWTFYVSVGTTVQQQEIEFAAPNEFEMRTDFGSNGGTYEVTKAYIRVTYSTNDMTYDIPYEYDENGELLLDLNAAFSIYE